MKTPDPQPAPSTRPAVCGNPAYPSLQAREKIIAENKKHPDTDVKKIPADQIKEHEASSDGTPQEP